jgi:hypothetical protein
MSRNGKWPVSLTKVTYARTTTETDYDFMKCHL